MSNVLVFKKTIATSRAGAANCEAVASLGILPLRVSEIRKRQMAIKEDVRLTVLMLDLAVAQARRFADATGDSRTRQDINDYLASVEDLLELARQKAIAL
jgi:hypothetical protein